MNIRDLLEQRKQAILAGNLDRADLVAMALAGDEKALKEVEAEQIGASETLPSDDADQGAYCGGCRKIVPFSACYEEFGRNWLSMAGNRRCKDCRKVEKAAEALSTPVWYAIDDLELSPSGWFMSEAEAVKYAEKHLRPGQEYNLKTYRMDKHSITTSRRCVPQDEDVAFYIHNAREVLDNTLRNTRFYGDMTRVYGKALADRLLRHLEDEADDMVAQNWRPEDSSGR